MYRKPVYFAYFLFLLAFVSAAEGTDYYVDSVDGNDSDLGTSPGQAWKSLTKVNSIVFSAGDRLFFEGRLQNLLCFKGLNHV